MEKHLKPHQYYSDLYDRSTVNECRRIEKIDENKKLPKYKDKELSKEDNTRMLRMFSELQLYFTKGERYLEKEKTIQEWIKRDEDRDRLFEQAKAPENITCLTCSRLMFVHLKDLHMGWDKEPDRVMFFYECPLKHFPMRVFYDNGEEYRPKPHLCSKCGNTLKDESKRTKKRIITTGTCTACGNIETSEIDLTTKEEKPDLNFVKDRERFCMTEKEGVIYADAKMRLHRGYEAIRESQEREKDKELYDQVAKMKKFKIVELEQFLSPILEKARYIRLQFKDPQISKDIFVPFVVHDMKPDRNERASVYDLERILRKTLKETNWRLMTDGASYRLGMLEGRLRAYEREEDLINLIRQKEKKE